jgi:hypothetical protein
VRPDPAPPGRRLLGEVAGVSVAVPDDASPVAVHLQQAGGDAIEERPVVRDRHRGAPPGAQVLLQPVQGAFVEVVGRLVQQQHLRRGRQDGRQPQPDPFPAGETAHGAAAVDQTQPEPVQGAFHPRVGVIAAAQLEDRHQVPVLGRGRLLAPGHRRLQAAHPLLDGAQTAQRPVDDLLDGRVRRRPPVLGEIADATGGLDDDAALVRLFAPGEQPQQGGLAGAVLSDDPGALARGQGAGHLVKDEPAVVGLADTERGDLCRHASTPEHSRTGRPSGAARPGERFGRASITPLMRQLLH